MTNDIVWSPISRAYRLNSHFLRMSENICIQRRRRRRKSPKLIYRPKLIAQTAISFVNVIFSLRRLEIIVNIAPRGSHCLSKTMSMISDQLTRIVIHIRNGNLIWDNIVFTAICLIVWFWMRNLICHVFLNYSSLQNFHCTTTDIFIFVISLLNERKRHKK